MPSCVVHGDDSLAAGDGRRGPDKDLPWCRQAFLHAFPSGDPQSYGFLSLLSRTPPGLVKATTKVFSSHGPCCHDEVKLSCLSRAGLVDEGDRLSRKDTRLRRAGTREQFFRQHICWCYQMGRPRSALFAECLVTPRRRWHLHPRGPEQDTKTP